MKRSLDDYLSLRYEFHVIPDPDGLPAYVVLFPDLPGCLTQVERLDEVIPMAEDVRRLWLETAYEQGLEIPLPGSQAAAQLAST
ncbi:MAG: type II toxin-antitoxin system HicB family antitoxin [Chloroflexi bacterium]|nr:type II toxin-antitoxin system HicB family antitoxin [Chloroflexota bacterium]